MTHKTMILDAHPDRPREAHGLRAIGYWRPRSEDLARREELDAILRFTGRAIADRPDRQLPWPGDFVDWAWEPRDELQAVVAYLERAGSTLFSFRGSSTCRLCGRTNGSTCTSDGTFVWPSGLAHYVRDHGVRPDQEFVDHVHHELQKVGTPALAAPPPAGRLLLQGPTTPPDGSRLRDSILGFEKMLDGLVDDRMAIDPKVAAQLAEMRRDVGDLMQDLSGLGPSEVFDQAMESLVRIDLQLKRFSDGT